MATSLSKQPRISKCSFRFSSWRSSPPSFSTSSTPRWVVAWGVSPRTRPSGQGRRPAATTIEPVADGRLEGVAALRARQPDFDPARFLTGARSAYEMIVKAFAAGERETLKPLLADDVMANFEAAIAARETEGRTEKVEFMVPPRVDLESVAVEGDIARAVVRILAEVRARSISAAGEAVDDRRTAELWTFERDLKIL
jgi:predicted lipid-binding transport protein (Tim44 family)